MASEWDLFEQELAERYHLDAAQLRWRRWCIAANCGGDEEVFAQEYPASAEEAFLTSGRPVFAMRSLAAAYAEAPSPQLGQVVENHGRLAFVQGEAEFLRMYLPPFPGREYVMGVDVAAGLRGGDYSAIAVLEKESGQAAAFWHGHMEPDLFAYEVERLARFYGRALIVPEANNHGIAVLGGLKRLNYGHIYRRSNSEAGFLTTARSKAEAVGALAAYIREDAKRIRDKEALSECMSYVYDEKGHTNAEVGRHDDLVMALALAVWEISRRPTGPAILEADWREVYGAYESTGY